MSKVTRVVSFPFLCLNLMLEWFSGSYFKEGNTALTVKNKGTHSWPGAGSFDWQTVALHSWRCTSTPPYPLGSLGWCWGTPPRPSWLLEKGKGSALGFIFFRVGSANAIFTRKKERPLTCYTVQASRGLCCTDFMGMEGWLGVKLAKDWKKNIGERIRS